MGSSRLARVRAVVGGALTFALIACASDAKEPPKTASDNGQSAAARRYDRDPFPSTYHPYPGVPTLVRGATIYDGEGGRIERGSVLFADGKIISVDADVQTPAGATVIDGTGLWVTPGVIDIHSHLGDYPSPGIRALSDGNEATAPATPEVWAEHSVWPQDPGFSRALANGGVTTLQILPGSANLFGGRSVGIEESTDVSASGSPFAAGIDVSTAINPDGAEIGNERAGGVTRALVAPGTAGSIFAGRGAVIDLGADADPVTRARAFQYVELGEEGARRAGGSRPAAYAMLRDAFAQALDYRRSPSGFGGREKDSLLKRADAQALLDVLDGKTPLLVHVERAADIRMVLSLRRDYPAIKLVLVGATEGWMVAQEIAAARVPVIAAALADLPFSFESLAATETNVGRLTRAGVSVGISTVDINTAPGEHVLAQYAGNLVAIGRVPRGIGLDRGQAFATITSKPAAALGMDGEIGSLRAGRRADVVIWDGDPLELSSAPEQVFIDGRVQPVESRQMLLQRRYATPTEGALPKAYDR